MTSFGNGNKNLAAFKVVIKSGGQRIAPTLEESASLVEFQSDEKYVVNVSEKNGKVYFHRVTHLKSRDFSSTQPAEIVKKESSNRHSDELGLEQFHSILNESNQNSIISDPVALSKFFGGNVESGQGVRQRAEQKISRLGMELGFASLIGYGIPNLLGDGRNRFISVVWMTGKEITVAFQVRRKRLSPEIVTSLKDRRKLYHLHSKEKYIVNVSEYTGKPYFHRVTGSNNKEKLVSNFTRIEVEQKPILNQQVSTEDTIDRYRRAGMRWSSEEDAELIKGFQESLTVAELSRKHQRKYGAIRARLAALGLIEDFFVFRRKKST